MQDTMTRPKDSLTSDQVAEWLERHPDFFIKNPEVLDFLKAPAEKTGKRIVDFQQYMVERLRADRDEVVETTREIVENSRANMNNLARVHKSVLLLLAARDFEDFVSIITMDLAAVLDVDIISITVESEGSEIPHVDTPGIRALPPGNIGLLMKDKNILLDAGIKGFEDIFGGAATLVKSQALVRLHIADNGPAVMLALGSRDPHLFHDGQGTELLSFLSQAIELQFRSWLQVR